MAIKILPSSSENLIAIEIQTKTHSIQTLIFNIYIMTCPTRVGKNIKMIGSSRILYILLFF